MEKFCLSCFSLQLYQRMQKIQNECIQLTIEKTRVSYRINYSVALQCAELSMEKIRQEELRQSVIEANSAAAELDCELVRKI